jgi:cation diffusion facilitator CzcD-associated flavoprotein CzcO
VVVIGASAAGLATSACLKRAGVEHVLLEAATEVGVAWRHHYDRLHLHTHTGGSALPYLPFPRKTPRYASRDQVVAYLEGYVSALGLAPRLGEPVTSLEAEGPRWVVHTTKARYHARDVVVATGLSRVPYVPTWPGREAFAGTFLHSSGYRNGEPWRGGRVLVIGFGNSAGEIALDLYEHGAAPTLSVRGAVNVIPREILGLPVLVAAAPLRALSPRAADAIGGALARVGVGDIEAVGLRRLPYGPMVQLRDHHQTPLIDIGTIAALRSGQIALRGGVERFTREGVRFEGGAEESYDAVVAATGYRARLDDFLGDAKEVCGADGLPSASGEAVRPGLYFCGMHPSPRGMLRQIGIDARRIARAIAGAERD